MIYITLILFLLALLFVIECYEPDKSDQFDAGTYIKNEAGEWIEFDDTK